MRREKAAQRGAQSVLRLDSIRWVVSRCNTSANLASRHANRETIAERSDGEAAVVPAGASAALGVEQGSGATRVERMAAVNR